MKAAVARRANVCNDDMIVRTLFRATTGKTDFKGHDLFSFGVFSKDFDQLPLISVINSFERVMWSPHALAKCLDDGG